MIRTASGALEPLSAAWQHQGMDTQLADDLVRLREWVVEDADWYVLASKDHVIQRFTSDPLTLTAQDVAKAIEGIDPARSLALLITDAHTRERLGGIAVELADGVGHVSYWVAAEARGRGVATAAIRLVADLLLSTERVSELRLWTHEDNAASRRAAVKAGFVRDPRHDEQRVIKGTMWPTVGYRRT